MARHFLIADAKRALSSEIYKWRRDAIAQHIEKIKTLFPLVTERLDSLVALIKKKFTKSKKTLMDNIEEIKVRFCLHAFMLTIKHRFFCISLPTCAYRHGIQSGMSGRQKSFGGGRRVSTMNKPDGAYKAVLHFYC